MLEPSFKPRLIWLQNSGDINGEGGFRRVGKIWKTAARHGRSRSIGYKRIAKGNVGPC